MNVLRFGPTQAVQINLLVQRGASADHLVRQYVSVAKAALLACKADPRRALFEELDANPDSPLTLHQLATASNKSERGSPWWPATLKELRVWVHLLESDLVDTADRSLLRPTFAATSRRLLLNDSLGGAPLDAEGIVAMAVSVSAIWATAMAAPHADKALAEAFAPGKPLEDVINMDGVLEVANMFLRLKRSNALRAPTYAKRIAALANWASSESPSTPSARGNPSATRQAASSSSTADSTVKGKDPNALCECSKHRSNKIEHTNAECKLNGACNCHPFHATRA